MKCNCWRLPISWPRFENHWSDHLLHSTIPHQTENKKTQTFKAANQCILNNYLHPQSICPIHWSHRNAWSQSDTPSLPISTFISKSTFNCLCLCSSCGSVSQQLQINYTNIFQKGRTCVCAKNEQLNTIISPNEIKTNHQYLDFPIHSSLLNLMALVDLQLVHGCIKYNPNLLRY